MMNEDERVEITKAEESEQRNQAKENTISPVLTEASIDKRSSSHHAFGGQDDDDDIRYDRDGKGESDEKNEGSEDSNNHNNTMIIKSSDCTKSKDKQQITRFPVKLMAILEAGTFDDIISWTPDGLSFVVSKPKALVEVVFPLYFKKEVVKYSSFTRKLHRWGFIKIIRGRDLSAYSHKNFKRGQIALCEAMRCSKPHGLHESYISQQQSQITRQNLVLREHERNLQMQTELAYIRLLQHQHALGIQTPNAFPIAQREHMLHSHASGMSHFNNNNLTIMNNGSLLHQNILNNMSMLPSAQATPTQSASLPLNNGLSFPIHSSEVGNETRNIMPFMAASTEHGGSLLSIALPQGSSNVASNQDNVNVNRQTTDSSQQHLQQISPEIINFLFSRSR